jgi:hypothetical protein
MIRHLNICNIVFKEYNIPIIYQDSSNAANVVSIFLVSVITKQLSIIIKIADILIRENQFVPLTLYVEKNLDHL